MDLSSNPFDPVSPRPLPEPAPVIRRETCDCRDCRDWDLSVCERCTIRHSLDAWW
jgi:hypothetical protein